jgi:hypothetical protein
MGTVTYLFLSFGWRGVGGKLDIKVRKGVHKSNTVYVEESEANTVDYFTVRP